MENNDNMKKIIISSVVLLVLIVIIICIMVIDLPFRFIFPVKTIFNKRDSLKDLEANLVLSENSYTSSLSSIEEAKSNYESQKKKYEAISDETVRIIKDAYTTQDYSIEYMWIKLGNYADRNRLSIVLVEPGGIASNDEESSKDTNTVTSSSNNNSSIQSQTSSALKIKITGSYLDISNFIFELESDSELKFRLDNILMELVSGTTVSATFEVKNVVISK